MSAATDLYSQRVLVEDAEDAFELSMREGWGDGLPIIPATEARVRAFIDHVGLDPQHSLGTITPANEDATIERLAINAVMAGCRPEFFPVVIAIVEAILEPAFNLHAVSVTTSSANPMIIVNGPVREQLGINCDVGAMGPGWRANATIGRSLRLILQSVGGCIPGPVTKSMLSSPLRYSFCFGEDEERSPWTPLHVDRGFRAEDSTVTVTTVDSMWFTHDLVYWDKGQRFIETTGHLLTDAGNGPPKDGSSQPTVVLQPALAARLQEQGVSKEDFRRRLFESSRVPREQVRDFPLWDSHPGLPRISRADGFVQPCESADEFLIVCAGGDYAGYAAIMPSFYVNKAVTKKIQLPAPRSSVAAR